MDKNTSSKSGRTAATTTSKRIKNTFVPSCRSRYFTPATLFAACRYGFPFEDLPEEGKRMVLEYIKEYDKGCTKPGEMVDLPPLPSGPGITV